MYLPLTSFFYLLITTHHINCCKKVCNIVCAISCIIELLLKKEKAKKKKNKSKNVTFFLIIHLFVDVVGWGKKIERIVAFPRCLFLALSSNVLKTYYYLKISKCYFIYFKFLTHHLKYIISITYFYSFTILFKYFFFILFN